MSFCFNCGATITHENVVCPSCGQKQDLFIPPIRNAPDQQPARPQTDGPATIEAQAPAALPQVTGPATAEPQPLVAAPQAPGFGEAQTTAPSHPQADPGLQQAFPSQTQPYPGQQQDYGYPPIYVAQQMSVAQSPKSRTTTILLSWFLGWLGIHRFYLGRVGLGVIMLLTLGGLGIWALVDFILATLGKLKDSQGRVVNGPIKFGLVLGIIIGSFVLSIILLGILSAIIIPQYQKYTIENSENIVESQIDSIVSAQKLFYLNNNQYTEDIQELEQLSFTKDPSVEKIRILVYSHDCYFLEVKVKDIEPKNFDSCTNSVDISE
jgi:Tfp pilus assembly protein PilE